MRLSASMMRICARLSGARLGWAAADCNFDVATSHRSFSIARSAAAMLCSTFSSAKARWVVKRSKVMIGTNFTEGRMNEGWLTWKKEDAK